jgi:hypothetical protein
MFNQIANIPNHWVSAFVLPKKQKHQVKCNKTNFRSQIETCSRNFKEKSLKSKIWGFTKL